MNDFQKYVLQNKDRAKAVGPGVYRIPLVQEQLTPSFKINSPYMQGAENGGLYAFVDSSGNIIPNQDIEYDSSDNQYYKVTHLPDTKVEAPSLSAYNDPNYTNILTGNYYGHKFVPTEQNVKYYQKLYENDHKIREGYGPHGLAQLGGVLGVGAALATTGAYAPTIAGWTYRTALPWIAENLAVPTIVAGSVDLAQNALFGTTSSQTVSNFLQDNLHVPQPIADIAGEATNPGWYVPSSYGAKVVDSLGGIVKKGYEKFVNPFFGRFTSDGWFTIGNKQYRPSMSTLSVGFPVIESKPAWQLEPRPGYQVKSLVTGSPLEKQLSKNGMLPTKQLQAYINKNDVSAVDKEILGRVLANHPNETHIDYNVLRQEAQAMIPKYTRVPQTKYETYGLNRIGYKVKDVDSLPPFDEEITEDVLPFAGGFDLNAGSNMLQTVLGVKPYSFTFESPGIKGSTKHYQGNPIGHSRTYTADGEPDILYVMESQSDWAQNGGVSNAVGKKRIEQALNFTKENLESGNYGFYTKEELEQKVADLAKQLESYNLGPIQDRMVKTYTQRQIQENLQYAASKGQTKMRYPTPETAAKLQGYPSHTSPEGEILYFPEHQTILRKYAEFPKQYQKLFGKNIQVRTVTDSKGNTWYEVDVPESYLDGSAEMLFKKGGILK